MTLPFCKHRVGATLAVAQYGRRGFVEHRERKNMRLREYDYAQEGPYFITVCTDKKKSILAVFEPGEEGRQPKIKPTELGSMTESVLQELTHRYGFDLYAYVVMPNHVHLLISPGKSGMTVGKFIGAWKSVVSNRWQKVCTSRGVVMGKLWQRNYYDHVIRKETDFLEKWKYIEENPVKWQMDELFP